MLSGACQPRIVREGTGRLGHGIENMVDKVVRRDAVGQRFVGQDDAVAHDVRRQLGDVMRHHVVAAACQRQRPRGEDEVDRGARTGAE